MKLTKRQAALAAQRARPATSRQRAYLHHLTGHYYGRLSRGRASDLIDAAIFGSIESAQLAREVYRETSPPLVNLARRVA
jgi:hypothetical protein